MWTRNDSNELRQFERTPEDSLGNRNRFIITSKLKDDKNVGSIRGTDQEILTYFVHKDVWKPHDRWRGGIFGRPEYKTTDIRIESVDKTLLGEIHEFPIFRWMTSNGPFIRRIWEIHRVKTGLEGVVRDKASLFSSDWILETIVGETISSIRGNRWKKNYEILSKRKKTFARCYRGKLMDKNSYFLDIQRFEIDLFLLLSYVIVLDCASKRNFFITGRTSYKWK
jgi:hypothetical protein